MSSPTDRCQCLPAASRYSRTWSSPEFAAASGAGAWGHVVDAAMAAEDRAEATDRSCGSASPWGGKDHSGIAVGRCGSE